jgi:hypothetical protein
MTWARVRNRTPELTGAPSLGEQWPHFCDGPSDGGAVDTQPAGEHVVRGGTPEVHKHGQKPVYEHQPVLRTRAHGPLPRPGRKLDLVPFVPQRAQLCDEFSDHVDRQARDSTVTDDRCTRRVPHHTTMIDDQTLDTSLLTVHELASSAHEKCSARSRCSRGGVTPRRSARTSQGGSCVEWCGEFIKSRSRASAAPGQEERVPQCPGRARSLTVRRHAGDAV